MDDGKVGDDNRREWRFYRREGKMNAAVTPDRAKMIIQGWYNRFCQDHGKQIVELAIEEGAQQGKAYSVSNPESGAKATISYAVVADYESSGAVGIPGDLKFEIWDAFQDLG
jgi:hypothetical protein